MITASLKTFFTHLATIHFKGAIRGLFVRIPRKILNSTGAKKCPEPFLNSAPCWDYTTAACSAAASKSNHLALQRYKKPANDGK